MRRVEARPLNAEAFARFGDVIARRAAPDRLINQGLCGRHHDLAALDFSDGRAGISVFEAEPRALPHKLEMMERHPAGSQAFIPMSLAPFLVIVAEDANGAPGRPAAFLTAPGEGVNIGRNTWHGVLTPLEAPGLFAVIDRVGPGANLEEHWFETPWVIDCE